MSDHTRSGLPENIAALLSYVLGWITGLVFLLIDKRPYVRFHAAQSIVVFLGLHALERRRPRPRPDIPILKEDRVEELAMIQTYRPCHDFALRAGPGLAPTVSP
jgi:uncharacterized membrane protein